MLLLLMKTPPLPHHLLKMISLLEETSVAITISNNSNLGIFVTLFLNIVAAILITTQFSYVDQVYAGPTFNNAPAPSALPIPAFNARGSPINYPQPLYHSVNPSLQQQSMDLMNLITPQKVVHPAYELEKTNLALSEIQRGLRSMLKIES